MPWRVLRACITERGNVLRLGGFYREVSEASLQYCRILGVILGRALRHRFGLDLARAHYAGEYIEQPGNRVGSAAIALPGRVSLHCPNVFRPEIDPRAAAQPRAILPAMLVQT